MEKLNITMEKLDGNELILRTGSAMPIEVPKKIKIAGDIKTVSEFIKNRISDGKYLANNINLAKTHIRISRDDAAIEMLIDEQSDRGMTVFGDLESNPDLKIFNINADNVMLNLNQLAKLIRNTKFYFKDQNNAELLKSLEKFAFNKTTSGNIIDDRKGNKDVAQKSTLDHNVNLSFILDMPIFRAGAKKTFMVEIYCDLTDGGMKFWLESQELRVLEKQIVEETINAEYDKIKDSGILIVQVS